MDIRDPEYRGMVELSLDRKDEILALRTENKKLREALQSWIDVNRGAPNKYNWAEQALKETKK